jgi:hypothetical protein
MAMAAVLPVGGIVRPRQPHRSEFDQGGHFAAMEQQDLYVGDLRTFVSSLDGR